MVYVFLANGFEEIEALGFTDILRRADIEVSTVSIYTDLKVTGSHGISVLADMSICELDLNEIDALVLPGGMPGTLNLQVERKVNDIIDYAVNNRKIIGAICAAPMILGEKKLLDDKKATCYPGFEEKLHGAYATGERVVKDDIFVTSKGAGTVQDFAHCFIKIFKGEEVADKIISSMQY